MPILKKTTSSEYHDRYIASKGYVLIYKDVVRSSVGDKIIIPGRASSQTAKFGTTGKVVSRPMVYPESYYDQYLMSIIRVGMTIGYLSTVPISSPIEPDFIFENKDKEDEDRTFTLHLGDIFAILPQSIDEKKEIELIIKKANICFYEKLHSFLEENKEYYNANTNNPIIS